MPLILADPVMIHIAAGTYVEEVVINRARTALPLKAPGERIGLTIEAEGVTLDGWDGVTNLDTGLQVTNTTLILRGMTITGFNEQGVEIDLGGAAVLENCTLIDNPGDGVRIAMGFGELNSCTVANNRTGVRVAESGTLETTGTTFAGNQKNGIAVRHAG